jgi:hypothetical protein
MNCLFAGENLMLKLQRTLCFGAACLALSTLAGAANDPRTSTAQRLAPIARPTPEAVAAARAAALARSAPPALAVSLPTLSAQQIVERNVAARGGLQAWQGVSSMSMVGKLDAGKQRQDGGQIALVSKQERSKAKAELRKALQTGKLEGAAPAVIQLPFSMELKRPVMTRLEIPFQGQTAVQVFDGVSGWKLRPFLGRHEVEPYSPEELKLAASQQELDGPLLNHVAKGTTVVVDGGEMVDGRAAYKLKLTLKNQEVRHVWIDAKTFLELKIEGAPRRMDGKWRSVVTYLRDYRSVQGLQIAHRLETSVEGVAGGQNIVIDTVALNPSLDASRFSKPM